MQKSTALPIAIIIFILISACCICGGLAIVIGYQYADDPRVSDFLDGFTNSPRTETLSPASTGTIDVSPVSESAFTTLALLENTTVPVSDPIAIAARLMGVKDVANTVPGPTVPLKVGERESFWVTNDDTLETFQVNAIITLHLRQCLFLDREWCQL